MAKIIRCYVKLGGVDEIIGSDPIRVLSQSILLRKMMFPVRLLPALLVAMG